MSRFMTTLGIVVALVAGLWLATPPEALAGQPTDQLRQQVDRVLTTLDAQPQDQSKRWLAVRGMAYEIFSFEETARRALGRHWNQRSPAEREEFVKLFSELLERSYLSKIGQYSGEKVTWLSESMDGDQALVRTKIVTPSGSEIPVDYRMLRDGDRWRVYDVVIEGVSLVNNYRTQFNRIIETASYNELVSRLRSRALTPQS